MAVTALATVYQAIETAIEAAPKLATVVDDLTGHGSATLLHNGASVQRIDTRRVGGRHQSYAVVEDRIRVRLTYQVKTKNQRSARDSASVVADNITDRITDTSNAVLAPVYVRFDSETETRQGEWFVIDLVFKTRREKSVGAG